MQVFSGQVNWDEIMESPGAAISCARDIAKLLPNPKQQTSSFDLERTNVSAATAGLECSQGM